MLQVAVRKANRNLGGALGAGLTNQWDALEILCAFFPDAVDGYEADRVAVSAYGGIWDQAKSMHRLAPSVPAQVRRITQPTGDAYALVRVATPADMPVLDLIKLPPQVVLIAPFAAFNAWLEASGRGVYTLAVTPRWGAGVLA